MSDDLRLPEVPMEGTTKPHSIKTRDGREWYIGQRVVHHAGKKSTMIRHGAISRWRNDRWEWSCFVDWDAGSEHKNFSRYGVSFCHLRPEIAR